MSGTQLYVTTHGTLFHGCGFTIVNVGGINTTTLRAGTAKMDNLQVDHELDAGIINIQNGLQTPAAGIGNLSINAVRGAGLNTCGDTSHGLSFNTGSQQFGCQAITGTVSSPGGVSGNIQYNNATNFGGISYLNTAASNGLSLTGYGGLAISSGTVGTQTGNPISVNWSAGGSGSNPIIPINFKGLGGNNWVGLGISYTNPGNFSNNFIASSITVDENGDGAQVTALELTARNGSPNVALQIDNGNVNIAPLSASQFVQTDASKNLVSYDLLNSTQTWTAPQSWTNSAASTFTALNVGIGGETVGTAVGGGNLIIPGGYISVLPGQGIFFKGTYSTNLAADTPASNNNVNIPTLPAGAAHFVVDTVVQNISGSKTFTSSTSFTGALGLGVTYGVTAGSATVGQLQVSSNTILANTTFYNNGTTVMGPAAGTTNAADFLLNVSSANGTVVLGVQNSGHIVSSGTVPSVSSCGTGTPSVVGTDLAGIITTGTGSPTACTLTFASPYQTNAPVCVCSPNAGVSCGVTSASTTAVTFTLSVTETGINYICFGEKG